MKVTGMIAAFVVLTLCACITAFAADPDAAHAPAAASPVEATAQAAHAPGANQPVLPPPGIRWPAVMIIIVLGMFLAAIVVGPVVRMHMPEEVPVSHTHDETHGHDRAHGHARQRPLSPGHDHGDSGHH